jgi:HK97 family phage prohead protease
MSVKALQEDGSFEGILASYNNVDLGGDRILPGAFTKTMQERGNEIPMLWQHDPHQPIGTLSLSDSATGLMVKGQLLMDLPQARNAYTLLKAKVIKGLSIGFDTIKDSIDNGVRQLKEVRLWEGSVVTFPMNEACMITTVKKMGAAEQKDDFNGELATGQLQDAGYQMRSALFSAIGSMVWGAGLSKEDKISGVKTVIDQFSDAFMSYVPQYLDWLSSEYGDMELMGRLQLEEKNFGALLNRGTKSLASLRQIKSLGREVKEGRKFSADTMKNLKAAQKHVKSMSDHAGAMSDSADSLDEIFGTLFDGEADDDPDTMDDSAQGDTDDGTSKAKAVPEVKTEPVEDHSADAETITGLISLIRKA